MSEAAVGTFLVEHGYKANLQLHDTDHRLYQFQYFHPELGVAVEFYKPPPTPLSSAEREYDQIRFLVTYHIKLIHRTFPGMRFTRAFAIGNFLRKAGEYARRHGGMTLLTLHEALQDPAVFTRRYPPLEYRSKALTAPVHRR